MADMNKAEKLAAARRKLKEYQKKNKDTTNKADSQKRTPKSASDGGRKGPYEQSSVFDSGTGESSPNLPVSASPVPAQEPPGPSNGYHSSVFPPLNTSQSLFSNLVDSRDFFDNLPPRSPGEVEEPLVKKEEPKDDPPVGEVQQAMSEMPECDISELDDRLSVSNILKVTSMPEDSLISSSTESLRQLSLQVNGLINDSVEVSGTGSAHCELERRNQELAALLSDREQKIDQLQLQLKEYQSHTSQLQVDLSQLQAESETRLAKELHPVQEQLQLHIQTVGILVGEKTELQAALASSQQMAKQKAAEVEELQGRLKVSRHKVMELEKELAAMSNTREMLENSIAEQAKEIDTLRLENGTLKRQLEEVEEDASEVRQKLNSVSNERAVLQQEMQEKQSQIDLLQLKVQQLTTSDRPDVDHLLEAMHQQKMALEWQVSELQQTVKSMGVDREHATQQYQDYLQQFDTQLKNMAEKLAAMSTENERLVNREQNLVKHISELEKQLQQPPPPPPPPPEPREMESAVSALQAECRDLAEQLSAQLQEKSALQKKLEDASRQIKELETDRPDADRLLATMESDKVAAAQAVAQNQKLKSQLEELQDSFIKMSNDKMELTERLQHEQHVNKELGEKLAQQQVQLHDARNHLEQKQQLLIELQENSSKLSSEVEQLRQFEEQGRLMSEPQNNGQQTSDRKDDMLASLSASVRQLELERNQLQFELQQLKQHSDPHVLPHPDVDPKSYICMKEAMEKLEARFTKTMQEVAELSDEKQKLEHIVLQLQGETETIGEYIALYQVQRSMLRQRAQEKDEQLTRLRKDREEMKTKLKELTNLVETLVAGKSEQHELQNQEPQGLMNGDVDVPEEPTNEAAGKIMALLSEIGSSNLVEPQMKGPDSFHPCPWCSGRLITI
ncbi:golgin subfamily A member 2 [Anabrus simplex]|uniref:golgin subfamily A member 2 n=1 Tax=Anabrus simplex TaxID=316456 RepID=UPI0035A3AEB6